MSDVPSFLGFPPPLLGPEPVRLAVPASGAGFFVLEKLAGVVWERSKYEEGAGVCDAVRAQLAQEKPEMVRCGVSHPVSVWPLEKELAGAGLLAERGEKAERWRNAFGSELLEFSFELLAEGEAGAEEMACELPVATHLSEARALISQGTGKKSRTVFTRRARCGRWSWWEARTNFPRWHQVRLHAAELGLRIVGETLYARGKDILLTELLPHRRLNKGEAKPLTEGLCLRLSTVDARRIGEAVFAAPEPERWRVLRKRLRQHAG